MTRGRENEVVVAQHCAQEHVQRDSCFRGIPPNKGLVSEDSGDSPFTLKFDGAKSSAEEAILTRGESVACEDGFRRGDVSNPVEIGSDVCEPRSLLHSRAELASAIGPRHFRGWEIPCVAEHASTAH